MRNFIHKFFYLAGCLIFIGFSVTSVNAQTVRLTTENYPPFNMEGSDGRTIGISTEIVQQLFERTNISFDMQLMPWQRAFKTALETPNHGVFSTTRTPEREEKFKWVGPLVENNWVFLAKEDRNLTVRSLEDASTYRIGGYQGDAVAVFLEGEGLELDLTRKDDLNAMKIDRDRIDLWATGHLLGPYYAKQNAVKGLVPVMTFKETIMSLAFNLDTDDEIINTLNQELEKMRSEGVLRAIELKYQ